ncbi:hypothetical protein D3C72_906540 [compost metagenome]
MADWTPRSPYESVGGYVWLPRLLDKVRQAQSGEPGEYFVLEASPLDQVALRLWGVRGRQIREWVQEGLSDEAIAQRVAETGGSNPKLVSQAFLLMWAPFILVLEADEGRLTGPAGAMKGGVPLLLGLRKMMVALGLTKAA